MTPIKKILIPTDGSENTKLAIARGLEIAKVMNADVTALNVVDMASYASFSDGLALPNLVSTLETEGKDAVEFVRQEGEKVGVKVTTLVIEGSPASKIIDESKEYDLIVMGTLGRTGVSKLMLGNVAEKVVRHAVCPVLVVRAPPTEE